MIILIVRTDIFLRAFNGNTQVTGIMLNSYSNKLTK